MTGFKLDIERCEDRFDLILTAHERYIGDVHKRKLIFKGTWQQCIAKRWQCLMSDDFPVKRQRQQQPMMVQFPGMPAMQMTNQQSIIPGAPR